MEYYLRWFGATIASNVPAGWLWSDTWPPVYTEIWTILVFLYCIVSPGARLPYGTPSRLLWKVISRLDSSHVSTSIWWGSGNSQVCVRFAVRDLYGESDRGIGPFCILLLKMKTEMKHMVSERTLFYSAFWISLDKFCTGESKTEFKIHKTTLTILS